MVNEMQCTKPDSLPALKPSHVGAILRRGPRATKKNLNLLRILAYLDAVSPDTATLDELRAHLRGLLGDEKLVRGSSRANICQLIRKYPHLITQRGRGRYLRRSKDSRVRWVAEVSRIYANLHEMQCNILFPFISEGQGVSAEVIAAVDEIPVDRIKRYLNAYSTSLFSTTDNGRTWLVRARSRR